MYTVSVLLLRVMSRFTLCPFLCLFQHIPEEDFNYECDFNNNRNKKSKRGDKKCKKIKILM